MAWPLFKKIDSKKLILWGYGLNFFDLSLYMHLAYLINQHFSPDNDLLWMQDFSLFNPSNQARVIALNEIDGVGHG